MPIRLQNLDPGLGALIVCTGDVTGDALIRISEKILSYGEATSSFFFALMPCRFIRL